MVGLQEIALGIATVLQNASTPESLPVTFVGQSIEIAAELVANVLGECHDACVALGRVELDPTLAAYLLQAGQPTHVALQARPKLSGEAHFYRRPADQIRQL